MTRKFPHVPGIDAAGVVEESHTPLVEAGDEVFITGFDLGQNTWGGFAQYVRVPGKWVMPLPDGLSLREVMIYGTAGLTAGQCVEALEQHGIEPGHGEVVVTGASGGVGSLAIGNPGQDRLPGRRFVGQARGPCPSAPLGRSPHRLARRSERCLAQADAADPLGGRCRHRRRQYPVHAWCARSSMAAPWRPAAWWAAWICR